MATTRTSAARSDETEVQLRVRVAALHKTYVELSKELEDSHRDLAEFIARSPEAIVLLDVETGLFIEANYAAEQLFGVRRSELLELSPFDLSPEVQPNGSSVKRGMEQIAAALRGETSVFEWWHRNSKGERIPCEIGLVQACWKHRKVVRAAIVDMTARKKLELSERGRRAVLDCIAHGTPLRETLRKLIVVIEDLLPGMKCSVLLLDPTSQQLHLGAAPSLPDYYNAAVEGLQVGPTVGSCGAAAFLKKRFTVSDVGSHPNWTAFRRLTKRAKLRACWSEPIFAFDGLVLGTFAMYYHEPYEPARIEIDAIETAALLAALAIEHERSQTTIREMNETLECRVATQTRELARTNEELRATQEDLRLSAVAFNSHDSIVITDPNGKILRVNPAFTKLTGFTADEVIGTTPRIVRSGRHNAEFYRDMWHQIRDNGYWQGEVWNRRKNGEEYLQRLTITCIRDVTGKITHYVGDGQDITDEKRAEADRAAIQAARRVQESLFPKTPPQLPGFDIAGAVHPANLASGDFYDFLAMGESSLGVLIADVSGHGLAPSLLMAQMQAYMLALAECHVDPGDLLTHANRLFGRGDSGHFVTVFLCRIHAASRMFTYAAAGHQGFLMKEDGRVVQLEATGIPLGIEPHTSFPSSAAFSLHTGDTLVLLTDGVEEAMSPQQRVFGLERAFDVVRA